MFKNSLMLMSFFIGESNFQLRFGLAFMVYVRRNTSFCSFVHLVVCLFVCKRAGRWRSSVWLEKSWFSRCVKITTCAPSSVSRLDLVADEYEYFYPPARSCCFGCCVLPFVWCVNTSRRVRSATSLSSLLLAFCVLLGSGARILHWEFPSWT